MVKLSVVQTNFNNALSVVSRILPARPSLPILSNILLKTEAARLIVSATNLELAITYKVGAKIESEGAITVPGRLLTELINSLANDKVQLTSADNNLRVKTLNLDSTLNGISAEDFPVIPAIKAKASLKLPARDLQTALNEVVVAAASDEARPVLNGVWFNLHKAGLTLAATDSYRLAESKLNHKSEHEFAIIIPVRAAQELTRLLNGVDGDIQLAVAENEAVVSLGDISLISRLIEGKYPDYSQIFPAEAKTRAVVNREEMIKTVRVAALFARESANTVKLELNKDQVLVSSNASQVGQNASSTAAKVTGGAMVIQLNARYLLDALSALPGETVQIELTGDVNPCLIRPLKGSKVDINSTQIIMPLRT